MKIMKSWKLVKLMWLTNLLPRPAGYVIQQIRAYGFQSDYKKYKESTLYKYETSSPFSFFPPPAPPFPPMHGKLRQVMVRQAGGRSYGKGQFEGDAE